nr:AlpA family phage regulatory protein [Brenneria ulupoensis]
MSRAGPLQNQAEHSKSAKMGFKRAHIYSLMKEAKTMKLGVRAVSWDSAEIDQWITDRLKERI